MSFLITQEYTVLAGQNGFKDVIIKPNEAFEPIVGDYKVTAYALIRKQSNREIVVRLEPGQKIKGVGEVLKESRLQDLSKDELRKMAESKGISYLVKDTIPMLIEKLS